MYSVPLCSAAKAFQGLGVNLDHSLGCAAHPAAVLGSGHVFPNRLACCLLHRDPVQVGPSPQSRLLLVGQPQSHRHMPHGIILTPREGPDRYSRRFEGLPTVVGRPRCGQQGGTRPGSGSPLDVDTAQDDGSVRSASADQSAPLEESGPEGIYGGRYRWLSPLPTHEPPCQELSRNPLSQRESSSRCSRTLRALPTRTVEDEHCRLLATIFGEVVWHDRAIFSLPHHRSPAATTAPPRGKLRALRTRHGDRPVPSRAAQVQPPGRPGAFRHRSQMNPTLR